MACLAALWCCGVVHAASDSAVRILTEEYPPYNYTEQGKITGLSTEVVEAVLGELKMRGDFQSLPWARAYEIARSTPDVLIYSIGRTPERDKLFKWVGVIATTNYYLFGRPGKTYKVDSLEAAKQYRIATVNEDVGEQFLLARGFVKGQNLQPSVKYEQNYEKLKLGRVDLWIMDELTASYLARQAGDDPAKTLVRVYRIPELTNDESYMAFGTQTSDATVEKFRRALERVKQSGRYEQLQRQWQ
ncbi:MAG: transporter substrate-binding domain-containing protein [Simplicispira suum]|uniref:substrate-binding periplasmic protein n=1 Tax=Simplicispira suum TaxID=2109915 RepID=UPI001C6D2219|nr:transporter substrate-binding domain-containing protein [Simplicispira suum]MBW7833424.1 transporter substrate-binding domain-containing protein [Simplicispira suum]